ncbi:MAG: class IV adenylate cyclase [Ignisphaera sp.]
MLEEFEVKVPVENLELIEFKLKKLGATLVGYKEEQDYYIDTRPCVDLASVDSALRLRISKDIQTGWTRYELTFKGPREKHDFAKIRKELTVEIADAMVMLDILKILGFKVLAIVSKKRKIYKGGNYRIYLDEVNGLGKFVEVEYVSEVELNRSQLENEIINLVKQLGIQPNFIMKSYLELILLKNKTNNT